MTTDPKATLPDEVDKKLEILVSAASVDWKGAEELGRSIRAHIAAQAEKIAVLKKCVQQAQDAAIELAAKNVKLEAQLSDASMDYYNQQQGKEKLEAENKRLREALEKIANNKFLSYENTEASMYGTGVTDGHRLAAQWARDALAQTASEVKA